MGERERPGAKEALGSSHLASFQLGLGHEVQAIDVPDDVDLMTKVNQRVEDKAGNSFFQTIVLVMTIL